MQVFGKETISRKDLMQIKRNMKNDCFVPWLRKNYTSIRCYHACRPTDISSYYKNGFSSSNFDSTIIKFKEFLKEVNVKSQKNLSDIIDAFRGSSDRFIYFNLDKCDYYKGSQHYWIYGSELMLALAENTDVHLKEYLCKTGVPTIFTCDVPLSIIADKEIVPLFERIKTASSGTLDQMLSEIFSNYTVTIDSKLESRFITSHEHPIARIWNYHTGKYYKNDITICLICKFD